MQPRARRRLAGFQNRRFHVHTFLLPLLAFCRGFSYPKNNHPAPSPNKYTSITRTRRTYIVSDRESRPSASPEGRRARARARARRVQRVSRARPILPDILHSAARARPGTARGAVPASAGLFALLEIPWRHTHPVSTCREAVSPLLTSGRCGGWSRCPCGTRGTARTARGSARTPPCGRTG